MADEEVTRADIAIMAIEVARKATLMSPSNHSRIPVPGDLVVEITIRHDMEGIGEVIEWPTLNGDGAITRSLFPVEGRPGTQRWRNAEFRVVAEPLATLLRMVAKIIPCEHVVYEARMDDLDRHINRIQDAADRERGKR